MSAAATAEIAEVSVTDAEPAKVDRMGADEQGAAIVITRRNMAWLVAGALTLMSGGNMVGLKVMGTSEDEPTKRDIAALSARVDALAAAQNGLAETSRGRQQRLDDVLRAVLSYQIEAGRDAREYRPTDHKPSPELMAAEERLRELAREGL